MTVNTGVTEGSEGYIGLMTQMVPGGSGAADTFVTPTADHFLPVESPASLESKFATMSGEAQVGSPDTNRQKKNTKASLGGSLVHKLMPDLGIEGIIAGIGTDAYVAAVTADTAASITTTNGVSTIVLTGGSGSYQNAAALLVDTGALQEIVPIYSWNSGTKTLKTPALLKSHGATPAIQQVAIHKTNPISNTGGFGNARRLVSVEENIGGEYSWQYVNGLVDKLAIKGAKDAITVTQDLKFDGMRTKPVTPTAYSETAITDMNLAHPFTFDNGSIIVGQDPHASGSSSVQEVLLCEDWSITLENGLTEHGPNDRKNYNRVFPGGSRKVTVDYSLMQSANRQAAYEDFVATNAECAFYAWGAQNIGTAGSPVWIYFCFYLPNVHWMDSSTIRVFKDPVGEKVNGEARSTGGDVLQAWYINSSTAAL